MAASMVIPVVRDVKAERVPRSTPSSDEEHRSQARYELYEDQAGEWRWRLVHRNGNIIADSGEGYTRKENAKKGLDSVRRNAGDAEIEEK